jgi:hypothetical protein
MMPIGGIIVMLMVCIVVSTMPLMMVVVVSVVVIALHIDEIDHWEWPWRRRGHDATRR